MVDLTELEELADTVNVFWLLVGSTMVFFMQIGFSMLEVGCVQEKSTKNVLIKNALDQCITSVCWATVGHGLAFGHSATGFLGGATGYFLGGRAAPAGFYAAWLFNWTFVSTAATIVSGAVAERIQFHAYASFVLLLSLLLYPLVVHWAWSDTGFLSARRRPEERLFGCGVVDLAGSGVVHVTGGVAALVAIAMLGPRDGVTFTPQGRKKAPVGQSAAFQTLGTMCLWFGWFGVNGCSVGNAVGNVHAAARSMVMTAVSGAAGGIASTCLAAWQLSTPGGRRQLQLSSVLNGILAGLVGITANCATVRLEGAFLIGVGSAAAFFYSAAWLETWAVDDVVSAVPVHLAAGLWGVVAAGFLTAPNLYDEVYGAGSAECGGLLYGGGGEILGANLILAAVVPAWVLLTAGPLFAYFKHNQTLRVGRLTELVGLDLMLHNDDPARYEDDDEMEATVGHAGTSSFYMDSSGAGNPRLMPLPGGTLDISVGPGGQPFDDSGRSHDSGGSYGGAAAVPQAH